jgi:translation elongation factor EF-1alpha
VARTSFPGELVLLEGTLRTGDEVVLRCGTAAVACTIGRIHEACSSETGLPAGGASGAIRELEAATVELRTAPVAVEPFPRLPALGRYVLERGGRPIAAGVVLETGA